jgi:hypothetical protein
VSHGMLAVRGTGSRRRYTTAERTENGALSACRRVHKAVAAVTGDDDLDMDPALAACVQLGLAGPHLVPPQEPATRPPLTVTAFGMHLHVATTVDGG